MSKISLPLQRKQKNCLDDRRITEILRKKPAEITDKIYENRIQHPNLAHAPGLSGAYMAGQNRRIFSERGGVLLPSSETA